MFHPKFIFPQIINLEIQEHAITLSFRHSLLSIFPSSFRVERDVNLCYVCFLLYPCYSFLRSSFYTFYLVIIVLDNIVYLYVPSFALATFICTISYCSYDVAFHNTNERLSTLSECLETTSYTLKQFHSLVFFLSLIANNECLIRRDGE